MRTRRGGEAQRLVRETMIAAGGYWRPLAALARLLEELGELTEQLSGPAEELAGELADLWIITTALADQFLAEVAEPGSEADGAGDAGALITAAGPIARVVNHYDGPKVPRAGTTMPTLHGAIAGFHSALASLARTREVDLGSAVAEKIERIHRRGDIERFGQQGFDPSTATVLDRMSGTAGLPGRLWGGPDRVDGASIANQAAETAPALGMFAKAALAESLEGFVVEGPKPPSKAGGPAWLGALVAGLDPTGGVDRLTLCDAPLSATLLAGPDGQALALFTTA